MLIFEGLRKVDPHFFCKKCVFSFYCTFGTPLPFVCFANSGWVPSEGPVASCGIYASSAFFLQAAPFVALIIARLRPRRIGICPVKTVVSAWGSGRKGALGAPVFEGHIRYPHGLKAHYNRGVKHRLLQKKMRKNLHICNFCCTFAAKLIKNTKT